MLEEDPPPGTPLSKCRIDWRRTRAWGEGGYVGRVWLNRARREPLGTVAPEEYETVRDELARALAEIPGFDGEPLETEVHRPEDLYKEVKGHPPDLLVYFGGLRWRSLGTLGHGGEVLSRENDTGPDGANHALDGVFILRAAGEDGAGHAEGHQLVNLFPLILGHLGIELNGE